MSKDTHKTKDGRTVKKGLYYYMNKRKKAGTSRKGKGTVSDKALKRSAKTAKGYGAARTRGMGLQDEKLKPGKVTKAALGVLAAGLSARKRMKDKKMAPVGMGAMGAGSLKMDLIKKILGKNKGGVMKANTGDMANKKNFKGYSKTFKGPQDKGRVATISGVKPNLRSTSKASQAARYALKGVKATNVGKIVLPIALAGVAGIQYLKSKMKKNKVKKKMGGGMMQKYSVGGPTALHMTAEQRKRGQRKKKAGVAGLGSLPGKRKEDSSVTLGKFMKAKVDALNESVKAGGMKADRVISGSRMRSPQKFRKDVEAGKYSKPSKDVAYYKSIGLTGKRGDKVVEKFFAPKDYNVGGSVTVKTKLGKNKPTKLY